MSFADLEIQAQSCSKEAQQQLKSENAKFGPLEML